jgi:hypothetical protein
MSNENEEILQVLSLFRHGKRNSFMNFETNEEYSTDLCEDSLITTINKGKKFMDKYFTKFPASPFNSKDFKCYISDSIRTIKSIIYRLIDLIPKSDFKSMKYQELKEYTLKNIPNAIYDDKIFKSYEYCDKISAYYCFEDPNYKGLFEEIEREISKKSEKALEVYKKYLKHPIFEGNTYAYFKICFISDFLFFITPEVQKNFSQEQLIIKDVMGKINANKRMIDIDVDNKNANLCFSHQLITNYYKEMDKVRKNAEDKKKIILFSAHDLFLTSLLNFLEIEDKSNYQYNFDDEINFILFKKKNEEKIYFRAEYNDEVLNIPLSTLENKKECELDTIMDKIKKEYLVHSFDEIMDFCHFIATEEFYPSMKNKNFNFYFMKK